MSNAGVGAPAIGLAAPRPEPSAALGRPVALAYHSRMLRRLLISALLLLFAPDPGHAAAGEDAPRFASVAPTDIPSGVVSSLAEDGQGFLWLGTAAGLVRHDGYRFRLYGNRWSVPGTLSTLFVRCLLTDPEGRVWVGADFSGLLRYATDSDQLERVDLWGDAQRPLSINALAAEGAGLLWAGSDGDGLFRLGADGQVRRFHSDDGSGLPDNRIDSLLVDADGALWVGSWQGLARRPAGQDGFEPVELPLPGPPPRISRLHQDSAGRLWAGTRDGELLRLDADGRWSRLPAASHAAPAAVHALLQASDEALWVGRADGIEIRDAATGALQRILRHDPDQPQGLAGNEVRALLRDRGGQIWVAGYGGGLQRHDPHNTAFKLLDRHSAAGRMLGDINVRSVAALRDGRVLLGTQDRGIAVLDAALQPVDLLRDDRGRTRFAGIRIAGLAEAADGRWWIGSDGGLFRYDPRTGDLQGIEMGPGKVRRLLADPDGGIWIGSESGLHRAEAEGDRAERVASAAPPQLDGDINALAFDAAGSLWIGGDRGLAVLPRGAAQARWVPAAHPARQHNPDVLGLLADAEGWLWYDTPVGLFRRFEAAEGTPRVEAVSERLGHAGRPFGANLLADADGRIWTQGAVFDPQNGTLQRLGSADGIDIGSAWFRAYARSADGRLLFGGSTGLLVVHPERYRAPRYDAPLVITALQVDGVWRAPPADGRLELAPGVRRLGVEFAALDYAAPTQLRYRHRVVGDDPEWRESESDYRVATLANLAPGIYRLEVQASDRYGRWTDSTLALEVHKRPAWWQQRGVQAAMALLLLLAARSLYRQRIRWLRARQTELERHVESRTRELQVLSAALKQKSDALEQASLTDPLTGLRNRRYFAACIDEDVSRSRRRHVDAQARGEAPRNADLVFFLVDLDHFKQVNDEFGHAAGDAVLIQMRERLQACFRDTDHLVRWGGEEFLVVSRDTDRHGAEELAGRAVHAVADFAFELPDRRRRRCTCSVGFAALPLQPDFPEAHGWNEAIDLADLALYCVKHAGRNGWAGISLRASAALPPADLRDPARLLERGLMALHSSLPDAALREAIHARAGALQPTTGLASS